VLSRPLLLACLALTGHAAEPLSRKLEVDFHRDVPSRRLRGLATRADGRLVPGPIFTDLRGTSPAPLLWSLERGATPDTWLLGTGPDGAIHEVTVNVGAGSFTYRELIRLPDAQVLALHRTAEGALLAGTSPGGFLCLVQEGQLKARVRLPVDSVLDLLPLGGGIVLAATGNPGRIYRVDLARLTATSEGEIEGTGTAELAARGVTLFGQIRDRNVRRLARLADGRIAAGSSPRGNLYAFPGEPGPGPEGGAPRLLFENSEGEVTDLLAMPEGDLFATVVFSPSSLDSRLTLPSPASSSGGGNQGRPGAEAPRDPLPPPATPVRFTGRSVLVRVPPKGLPEVLSTRTNLALYRLAKHGEVIVAAGGDQGELVGYDLSERLSLTFPGSASAQVSHLLPAGPTHPGRFLALRNNAPGLAWVDFAAEGPRSAETRRLELPGPGRFGAVRLPRLTGTTASELRLELRASLGSDDLEGWGDWTPLRLEPDGGWRGEELHGRSFRLRLSLDQAGPFRLDRATVYHLPQNRRPQLQEFRILPPGMDLIPSPEPAPAASTTLSQLLQPPREEVRGRANLNSSPVVAVPGARVATWTLLDPDGDAITATFSLRRDGETEWRDIVVRTRDPFARFQTHHLPEGTYETRLHVHETAPRPAAERLSHTFGTDELVVDHTPPEILAAEAVRGAEAVLVTVRGRDRLSLLEGLDLVFNHGLRESVRQPADGIRDGREETFILELTLDRAAGADGVEVSLLDAAGNATTRRLRF
jgi:hypothetical protein